MQPARVFVSTLTEFAAGVEVRQDQLDSRHVPLRVHVDRDATTIVANRNGPVDVDYYLNFIEMSGKVLIDGIIEDFENTMVQATFVRVADIHPWPLADSFQPLKFIDLRRIVFLRCGR